MKDRSKDKGKNEDPDHMARAYFIYLLFQIILL